MKRIGWLSLALAAVAVAAGCTNKQGDTEAPVYISPNLQLQPGFVNVGTIAPVQINTIVLTSHLKNPTATDPQGFATVQINSYTVHFRRTDGGTRVPPDQTFGAGVTIAANGTATLTNFPVLPASAIQQSPFDQLLPFNGGIDRETGKDEIQTTFDLTFYGQTVSGQRVQSETASGILLFRFAGATPLRKTAR
jgi:hypothetical protein